MSDWQPIDTAPKDGRRVLTVRGNGYVAVMRWVFIGPEGYVWADDSSLESAAEPTHWMPLPEAPK